MKAGFLSSGSGSGSGSGGGEGGTPRPATAAAGADAAAAAPDDESAPRPPPSSSFPWEPGGGTAAAGEPLPWQADIDEAKEEATRQFAQMLKRPEAGAYTRSLHSST